MALRGFDTGIGGGPLISHSERSVGFSIKDQDTAQSRRAAISADSFMASARHYERSNIELL